MAQLHLFGLTRSTQLNGCAARPLEVSPGDDGRQAVEVTQLDGQLRRVRAWPINIGKRASEEQIASVLSSPDLALQIILIHKNEILLSMGTNVDGAWEPPTHAAHQPPDLSVLSRSAVINRAFARAVLADEIWKAICAVRWMAKWGFKQRMESASGHGWRAKYIDQERDAKRDAITVEELHGMRFDFRFWLAHVPGADTSWTGLDRSFSRQVRMAPCGDDDSVEPTSLELVVKQRPDLSQVANLGRVLGHPTGDEPCMNWLLDADGRGIQWGYYPELWPKGVVRRLQSWGWEICNQNVCMRALDHDHAAVDGGEESAGSIAAAAFNAAHESELWGDLLLSLEYCQARWSALPHGKGVVQVPSRCEIPGLRRVGQMGPVASGP